MNDKNCSTRIPKFRRFVIQNFPFIEEDFDALTDYALICKIVEYLNKVIDSQNEVTEHMEILQGNFDELKSYVDNYFDNLDVQEEINNKLDEMAEDGTLAEIISAYIQMKSILAYNNVADLAVATNVVDGSFVRTYGYYTKGDDGGAYYTIRNKTSEDEPNGTTMIAVGTDYVAILATDKPTPEQFGCIGNGIADDTSKLQDLINYYESKELPLKLFKKYGVTTLSVTNGEITGGTLVEIDSENDNNIIEVTGGAKIDNVSFETIATSTAIRIANTITDGVCEITNCHFTGNGAEYIAVVRPNTIIKNCVFENAGYKVTHEVRFGTGSDNSTMSGCTIIDGSGFNIQTYNTKNIKISDNVITNKSYVIITTPVSPTLTVTVSTPDNETHLRRFGVIVDGVINSSATVTNNENGTYTVTFTNAVTSSNTITVLGWKSLENINVNGGCSNIIIDNNKFDGTGDSNIVVGNDYTDTLPNPQYVQITGNNLSNAHDAGIAMIAGTNGCVVCNNKIINCSLGCVATSYNNGIMANNLKNSVITDNNLTITDSTSQATACITCTNYSSNYYNLKPSQYTKIGGNSTNLDNVYLSGLGSESQEGFVYDGATFNYPAVVDLDTAFTGGHPLDNDYYSFTASGGGVSQDTTNMLVGTGCIKTGSSTSAYVNIRPKLTGMFKKSLVTFRLMAKAETAGDNCGITTYQKNNSGTVLNGTTHTIAPSNSVWTEYEFQVRTASDFTDDSSTRLRITGGTGHVFIDCISVNYQPLP